MTPEQKQLIENLIYSVQRVVQYAQESYLPYELAAAISRADNAQGECNQFVSALPTDDKHG